MLKTICIAALTTAMSLATAYGAGTPKECTDAHMKQMDAMIAKMTDAAKQKEATTALDMSKAEMKKTTYRHAKDHGRIVRVSGCI